MVKISAVKKGNKWIPSINGKTEDDGMLEAQKEFVDDVLGIILFLNKNGMTLERAFHLLHHGIAMGAKMYEDTLSEGWAMRFKSDDAKEIASEADEEYRTKLKEAAIEAIRKEEKGWDKEWAEDYEEQEAAKEKEERDIEEAENWNEFSEAHEEEAEP